MKKSLSPRREPLGLNKLEQVSWLVLRWSLLNKQAYTRGDDEENHLFHADCERLLPFAMLALCFVSSVRCSSLALLGIWIAWILQSYITFWLASKVPIGSCCISVGLPWRERMSSQLHLVWYLYSFVLLLLSDQHCSNECSLSQLLCGVFICKFHTVPLFQIDAFALTHLRTGLLLSLYILNSFSEQNGSTKRYQKF